MLASAGVGILAITLLLTLSGLLLKKKPQQITNDDTPGAFATRGTIATIVYGVQEVDPVFVWMDPNGPQFSVADAPFGGTQAGKGGYSKTGDNYFDKACLFLCIGPMDKIHRITENGKTLFEGPITRQSHPSGTQVDLGGGQWFKPFWGDIDQPVNTTLQGATNHGIGSRWPFCAYIEIYKGLGSVKAWPRLKFKVECLPTSSQLIGSSAVFPADLDDIKPVWKDTLAGEHNAGDRIQIRIITGVGGPETLDTKYVKISDRSPQSINPPPLGSDLTHLFRPGTVLSLSGSGNDFFNATNLFSFAGATAKTLFYVVDSTYSSTEFLTTTIGGGGTGNWLGITTVRIGMICYLPVKNPQGPAANFSISPVGTGRIVGLNYAHVLDEVLFSKGYRGAGLNRNKFSMASLEALGRRTAAEGLICNIKITEGETAASVASRILQDIHYIRSWDIKTGKHVFEPIRPAEGDIPEIPEGSLLPPKPVVETIRGLKETTVPQFTFSDEARNYRDNTLPDRDMGAVSRGVRTIKKISFSTCTDIVTAASIAKLREQEVFASPSRVKIYANREARYLRPGQIIKVAGEDQRLRIVSVQRETLSGKVVLTCLADFYGVPTYGESGGSQFKAEQPAGGLRYELSPPTPDALFDVFELPRELGDGQMRVIVPRARNSRGVAIAAVHFSRDGSTYQKEIELSGGQVGGVLLNALPATAPWEAITDDGTLPEMLVSGVDADFESLVATPDLWRLGRVVALIGQELCYLRNVISLGDGKFRLQGLLRARLGTQKLSHAAGTRVFVFPSHAIAHISSVFLQPDRDLYVKTQPFSSMGGVPLSQVAPRSVTLRGDAFRPMRPSALRTATRSDSWIAGGALSLKWAYGSPFGYKTGAGLQPAGAPTVPAPVEGFFRITFATSPGNVVKGVYTSTTPTFSYSNLAIVADFAGEPTEMLVTVENINGGLISDPVSITVRKA